MNRDHALQRLSDANPSWDILVIGGGATGLGIALDAAARGHRTALVEQHDFAKGTSSRSTKLAHGGVRYLRSGEIGLVRSALRERGLLERNAPHLVRRRGFVIPVYRRIDLPFYGFGLKVYEWLSGRLSFGRSRMLSRTETLQLIPTVKPDGLRGGVLYFDGQFDDARLALALARTASAEGAAVVNYARVVRLLRDHGRVSGAEIVDTETSRSLSVRARVVINATGIFTDEIRRLDDPAAQPMLALSSGVHLTVARHFLPGEHAMMIPRTSDGRVLFAVPWQDHVILGTTDETRTVAELEPRPLAQEIDFLLEHLAAHLAQPVTRDDILSVFTGLRPLVRHGNPAATATLSRDHVIAVSPSGLLTVTGGKWTTYRKMAEDAVTRAETLAGLPSRSSRTKVLPLLPSQGEAPARFACYGGEAGAIAALAAAEPSLAKPLHPRLPICGAEVVWAARHEMARTVDDILSRRTRTLQLDARAAIEAAPTVAALLGQELGRNDGWVAGQIAEFSTIAAGYLVPGDATFAGGCFTRS